MTDFIMLKFPLTETSNGIKIYKKKDAPDLSEFVYIKTNDEMEIWEHSNLQGKSDA